MIFLFTFFTVILFIFMIMFLPDFIVERHGVSMPLFYAKIAFISISGSAVFALSFAAVAGKKYLEPYISGLKKFMPLIKLMVSRDYKARYKRSVLGVLWSLLSPLMNMLVMTLVFSYVFRYDISNFPVYLLSGTLIFGFFSEATNIALGSISANRGIITKVYVPKYIFPMTKVFSSLVNLAFSLIALAVVILITKAPIHWTIILIPIPLIYLFVFVLGLSMLLSCTAVFFKDLQHLYGIFITAFMYSTPIFYPVTILPERLRPFMGLNPMYQYISYFRSLVIDGVVPGLWTNVVCVSFSLVFLFAGTLVFMSKQEKFILYI